MKKFISALLVMSCVAFTCTSQQLQLITAIITAAESLLPLVLNNPAAVNVTMYVADVLPHVDAILANPTAVNAATEAGHIAEIAIPILDAKAMPGTQQALATFVKAIEALIAAYPAPTPAAGVRVNAVQPKLTAPDNKKIDELRGKIQHLFDEIDQAK